MYVSKNNVYQKNNYCIDLDHDCDTTITPSSRSTTKKTRTFCEIVRLLNEKVCKMKSIAQINTRFMHSIVEEREFSNDIPCSRNLLITPMLESYLAVNYIKNIIPNNNIKDDSTLKRTIESIKTIQ